MTDLTPRRVGYVIAAAVVWAAAVGVRATPDASALSELAAQQSGDALAQQVYGIFKRHCIECHGEAKESGLDLRTDAGLQKGGVGGKVVVAHNPDASRLYQFVTHRGEIKMPDGGAKLSDENLDAIRRWIEAGASLTGVPEAVEGATRSAEELAKLEARPITPEERAYWAFVAPKRTPLPKVSRAGWDTNPIDALLLDAMTAQGLKPSPPADARTLVRRAYLDVLGLPPTPEEVDAFLKDTAPGAWDRLVDRLLASPHYGERWARHWMDLVRYADSGGYEFDVDRPEMWRYRDYLVDSFNADKPYDQFVKEQLAGDEYTPGSAEAMIATGFLRLGPEGGGNRQDALDDLVSTTSLTFLGLTVGCARCHNHKFDPIPQRDYYRMQAVFFSTRGVDHPLAPADQVAANRRETQRLEGLQRPLRQKKDALEAPYHKIIIDREVAKLPEYMQIAWRTPPAQRTDGQRLNVVQIERTLEIGSLRKLVTEPDVVALMPDDVQAQHAALKAEIEALDRQKPPRLPTARAIGEGGREPRPSYFLHRGSADAPGSRMTPGVLSVAVETDWEFPSPPADARSSWQRRGLAEWITSSSNPLTARVMVNRLWQHHFGEGLVRTPSNFGKMGEAPSHLELLDWLALEFIDRGWSLKAMHRLMLTSAAYRMSSADVSANVAIDPENRLFWRMPRVRLEAEIIRDAVLAAAGTLNRTLGGPAIFPYIDPDLFEKSSNRDWKGKPDDDPSTWRRSLYVFSKRSIRYPMFEAFDQPNLINSIDRRNRTTIAPQALILMNNPFVLDQSRRFADRVIREAGADVAAQVERAFLIALGRPPDTVERSRVIEPLQRGELALAEVCHVLLNLNEFLYRQ